MKPITLIFLSLILVACSNVTLVRRNTPNETAVASNDDNPDRIICSNEKVIGSNITQIVCRTARQIEEEEALSKRDLKRVIDRENRLPMGTSD